jgi:hypothetical protein
VQHDIVAADEHSSVRQDEAEQRLAKLTSG